MKYRVFNIEYDTETPHYEVFHELRLPKELILDIGGFDEPDPDEHLANLISDHTGWCVISYDYEEVQS